MPRRRLGPVATPASGRQLFLDGFRGLALIFMVLNHTGRWWLERPMGWPRYHLVYLTVTLAAPIFLFLAGFCMPLSFLNSTVTRGERYMSVAWKYARRGAQLVVAGWFLNLLVFPDEPLFAGGVLQTTGLGTTPHFFSGRDLVLNQHWNPGAVTCLWILGILFSLLPATYYLMKVRRVQVPWLVVLGQNALMLYFVHQVIVLTFLRQRFGVLFHSWWAYGRANALLVAALVVPPQVSAPVHGRGLAPRARGG